MKRLQWISGIVVTAGLMWVGTSCSAQAKPATVSDAQVESDVLKALAANPKLADQTITSNTVYGVVTLSGSVRNEETRKLAETIVSQTPGVQKVVDELTLDSRAGTAAQTSGSTAPPPPSDRQGTSGQQRDPAQQPPSAQPPPYDRQPAGRQSSDPSPNTYPDQGRGPGDGGYPAQPPPGPYGPPPRRVPYGQPPYASPPPYAPPASDGPAPYGAQIGGQPVTVPSGSMLRVRINEGLDSRHAQVGSVFDAVVLSDVVADGFVAIPRGATVQGVVVQSEKAGTLKGRGELALQLTQVTLGGRTYPIVSDIWSDHGGDKTARTVNSALGLGAVGAIVGGVAGGGAGAAIGAGVGGAAGVGASAASPGGQAYIPSEAILTFHLTQGAALRSVSQAEMDRLGYGVPSGAQVRRRYVQPLPYRYPGPYARYPYPY
ncbi:MAG: hypothetical protein NVSMB3_11780 [Acidobacteriaceae bacterium]